MEVYFNPVNAYIIIKSVRVDMPAISLCMIVRDEEKVLARCLESVKDVVDEIVIVDTGSLDGTKEIAAFYTDKIYDFTWIDNFAAARNYSFSRATKEYCMWMDADDVLPMKEKEKFWKWKNQDFRSQKVDVVMMKYVTAFDEVGNGTFSFYRERLLKRERGFLWRGRVHEAIMPEGNIEYLDVSIEHHSKKAVYSDRNLKIYEKMKKDGVVFGARDFFYYARELYYHEKYREAVEYFVKFLALPESFVENRVEAYRIAAYCCYKMEDEQRALDFLLQGLRERVPSGELCCDIGKHFYDRKDWEQAIFWYKSALQVPRKDVKGGFVSEEAYGYLPCLQLSVCYDRMGERKRAWDYHCLAGRCKPYGKEYLQNQKYFEQVRREIKGQM